MYKTKDKCKKHKLMRQRGYNVKINTVFTLQEAMALCGSNFDVINTLEYIYSKTEGGAIFRTAQSQFIALINIKYVNSWSAEMQVSATDLKKYIKEKGALIKTSSFATLREISKWTNNGCLINMYDYHQVFNSYTYELVDMFANIKSASPFIIWLKDFPLLPKSTEGPFLPIFSQSTCPSFADIAIPNNEEWAMITRRYYPTKCEFDDITAIVHVPWKNKIEKAFFRGSGTGCFSDDRNPRIRVARMSKERPDIIDAGITRCVQRDKLEDDVITFMHADFLDFKMVPGVPMPEFGRYKYILNIKGNGAAYRLPYLFFIKSTVLIVKSNFSLWFEPALVPWKHYVPVCEDLSDLHDIIEWCKMHDDECKQIAQNGHSFAKEWFTKKNIYFYLQSMFKSLGLCAK